MADEKHTWLNDQKGYAATTVGGDCVLGASLTTQAEADHLQEADSHFKTEAHNVQADYQPTTVNTDGWPGTQNAWRALCPNIALILCFLHGFLAIRDRCNRLPAHFQMICTRVWDCYHAPTATLFLTKIGELKAWATQTLSPGPGLDAILKVCGRAPAYALA